MEHYQQKVWICPIVEVIEQKAWHCTKAPSPLQMERRMRGEVLPTKHNNPIIFYILYWFEEK